MAKLKSPAWSIARRNYLKERIRLLNKRLSAQGTPVKVVEGSDLTQYRVTFLQGRRPPTNQGGE